MDMIMPVPSIQCYIFPNDNGFDNAFLGTNDDTNPFNSILQRFSKINEFDYANVQKREGEMKQGRKSTHKTHGLLESNNVCSNINFKHNIVKKVLKIMIQMQQTVQP